MGCQTSAWPLDPNDFESFLGVLASLKQLGFEGFESSYVNLKPQFDSKSAYDRIRKTGLRFAGISIALKAYDPHTYIPGIGLVEQVANGGRNLGAECVVVGGESAIHPLATRAKADALEAAAKSCKDAAIALAYHAADFDLAGAAAQLTGLAAGAKDLRFAIDAREGAAEFLSKNPRRVDAIHVAAGQSEADWMPMKKAIESSQWKGWIIVGAETSADAGPAREAVRKVFGA